MWRVVSFVAPVLNLSLSQLVRASLPINDSESSVTVMLSEDLAHLLRVHAATSHVRHDASLFPRETSQDFHDIPETGLDSGRGEAQLRPNPPEHVSGDLSCIELR